MRPLTTYLHTHLAAANAGVRLFHHASKRVSTYRAKLENLTSQVVEDRRRLKAIMRVVNVNEFKPVTILGTAIGQVAHLRPNVTFFGRTRLSDLLELETLRDAVSGKIAGWYALQSVAAYDDRISTDEIDDLIERAQSQLHDLHVMHQELAAKVFSTSRS